MEGQGLSRSEQRALHAMEVILRQEAAELDRRLSRMRPRALHRLADQLRRPLVVLAMLFAAASGALLVLALRTSQSSAVWAFTACWTMTLITVVRLPRAPREPQPHR